MSKGNFGQRLKREREMRGVSRAEICAATRIGTRFLEALENEQWEVLPGGIFNRGFIRAVARFLGLDEDDLVAEYDLAVSEQAPAAPVLVSAPAPRKSVQRRVLLVSLTALSVLALLGGSWLGWRWQHNRLRQAANESRGISAILALPEGRQPDRPQPVSQTLNDQQQPSPSNVSVGDSTRVAGLAVDASPSQLGSQGQGLELKIEAGKETRVSISLDGAKVFDGSIIAGQSRTFTARDDIDISANDAGALLLELNGQTLAPLGPPGQPGTATLTRSDLKPAGGAN
jgi:cytoskeleton protein RodZ